MVQNNPFEYIRKLVTTPDYDINDVSFSYVLREEYGLSKSEAKVIWIACPEFQEVFCRYKINKRKSIDKRRGDTIVNTRKGVRIFLDRRYDFTTAELDVIFKEYWESSEI